MSELTILYQDEYLVAVSKPAGMLVHRGMGAQAHEAFLLQTLRDQLGTLLYPVHRLDRPTAGVVVFALQSAGARRLQELWQCGQVRKTYQAIVRGWMLNPEGLHEEALDHPDTGVLQEARTRWRELDRCTVPIPVSRYTEARYSLLELEPLTGRYHQLRRHMARMQHPIIGDTTHGDRHHNHMLQERMGWWRLLLAATSIALPHPVTDEMLTIADVPENGLGSYWEALTQLRPFCLA
jgi:tRNA pseudouridine65 synthase